MPKLSELGAARRSGFTLIELLISMGLLGLLLGMIFAAFDLGTRIFQETATRQSSETQLRNIKLLLERDCKLSNFWYSRALSRPALEGDGFRDALSLSTLGNWDDPSRFDSLTGRPLWDRYVVWYATQETPGKLYRQVVEPSFTGPSLTAPYSALPSNLSTLDPNSNADLVSSRLLSQNVQNFETGLKLKNGTITTTIRLLSVGGKRPTSATRVEDHLEVSLTFRPKNSWPAI
jgi:prepilin-type N-terminal cleavage/methylation domain-containing protein